MSQRSDRPFALVTGAAGGIGEACCRALAREGFRVGVHHFKSQRKAAKLAGELEDSILLRADLGETTEIARLVDEVLTATGRIDVLVNNAGINVNRPMVLQRLEDYDATTSVVRGAWYLTRLVLRKAMLPASSGRIISITSVVGHTGNPGQVPYTMGKAALGAMTKSLAAEVGDRGILVNAVAPGFIETEMTAVLSPETRGKILERIPLGRIGAPEEVADVVAFLATRGHHVQGSVVHVNGGLFGG